MASKRYAQMVGSTPTEIANHNRYVTTRQVLRRLALNRGMSASQWRSLL